jgi:hypothetical protein
MQVKNNGVKTGKKCEKEGENKKGCNPEVHKYRRGHHPLWGAGEI